MRRSAPYRPDPAADRAARRAGAAVAELVARRMALATRAPTIRRGGMHDPPRPDGEVRA